MIILKTVEIWINRPWWRYPMQGTKVCILNLNYTVENFWLMYVMFYEITL